jgi:hypothetical protein
VFDKHSNKMTGTTGPTGGQTGGDKHPNKTTGTSGLIDGVLLFQSFYWSAYHLQFDHQYVLLFQSFHWSAYHLQFDHQ